jgi:hypothetical protein
MHDNDSFDQEAYGVAVASVRRHSMDVDAWKYTVVGALHQNMVALCSLGSGELPIASGFFSSESWWVVTTRRIASRYGETSYVLDPRFGIESDFGNFKGIKPSGTLGAPNTEVATVASPKGERACFEFETGKASMAPIYACMFWSRTTRFHYARQLGPIK